MPTVRVQRFSDGRKPLLNKTRLGEQIQRPDEGVGGPWRPNI
jgi:hypothetical protein